MVLILTYAILYDIDTSPNVDVRITSPPQPYTGTVGDSVTITCESDYTDSSIEWLDNDMNVVAMTSSGQTLNYIIDPVSDNLHNSMFTCRIVGGVRDPSITINVNGK